MRLRDHLGRENRLRRQQRFGRGDPDPDRHQHRPDADQDRGACTVNVALAARYRTDAVLTLDRRDFRARPLTPHKYFRLLPDDL